MVSVLLRITKRLSVLAVGAFFVWLAVWQVFPRFDNRAPLAIALSATYVVMAYGIIPALFRIFRIFYHPLHLPVYCTTPDGFASDPINIALVGSRRQTILAMEAAGWNQADRHTPLNVTKQFFTTLLRRPYPTAPMSSLYLFGRRQDLAFQKEIAGGRGYRHHVRFWAADTELAQEFEPHRRFWQRFHRPQRGAPRAHFWVGAASKDIGFAPVRHNAQITHMIDPDTDSERDLIAADLKKARQLSGKRTQKAYRPFSLRNRAWRGRLQSDGRITICTLR